MSKDMRITSWALARGYLKPDEAQYVSLSELRVLAEMMREEIKTDLVQELTDNMLRALPSIPRELQITNQLSAD